MSYFVLPRPEGTLAYKPSLWDSIMPGVKNFADSMGQASTDQVYKQAAKREGLMPGYRKNADGSWSIEYKKPDTDMKDILFALAGIKPMESILSPEEIEKSAPLTTGPKMLEGGGEVGLPDGSKVDNGVLRNAAGEMIGEFAPGYEPKPSTEALRSKMTQAFTDNPLLNKKTTKPAADDFVTDFQAAAERIKAGEDPEIVKIDFAQKHPTKANSTIMDHFDRVAAQQITGDSFGDKREMFTPQQEQDIADNMRAYGRSREEIIAAMRAKGLL